MLSKNENETNKTANIINLNPYIFLYSSSSIWYYPQKSKKVILFNKKPNAIQQINGFWEDNIKEYSTQIQHYIYKLFSCLNPNLSHSQCSENNR